VIAVEVVAVNVQVAAAVHPPVSPATVDNDWATTWILAAVGTGTVHDVRHAAISWLCALLTSRTSTSPAAFPANVRLTVVGDGGAKYARMLRPAAS
jgi:hypothetical protein